MTIALIASIELEGQYCGKICTAVVRAILDESAGRSSLYVVAASVLVGCSADRRIASYDEEVVDAVNLCKIYCGNVYNVDDLVGK